MKKSKKLFFIAALLFLIAMIFIIIDMSMRTKFRGSTDMINLVNFY